MENSGVEQSLVDKDKVASPADLEVSSCLRLLQRFLYFSFRSYEKSVHCPLCTPKNQNSVQDDKLLYTH